MRTVIFLSAALLLLIVVPAAAGDGGSPTALRTRIGALRAPDVAWRQIRWRSCLLAGLAEARARDKPLMLWVFIDRPVDDARC